MREMAELFGDPNFRDAYNAGPARLEDHLRRGRPLPGETQQYLAQIGELPAGPRSPGEVPARQPVSVVSTPLDVPSSSPRTTSGSMFVRPIATAPADECQHLRPKKNPAPSERLPAK